MNPLAVITNFAHRAALLGGDIGNPYRRGRDGLDRRDNFIQRAIRGLGLIGGDLRMFELGAHAFNRFTSSLLQAADQRLDLTGSAGSALRQGAHLFGDHGKPTTHFSGPRRLDRGIQGQQVGLFGNRADHRQHAADGCRLFGQLFDTLRVALHLVDQRPQPGQALADHCLALLDRPPGIVAGVGSLTGIAGHLEDGRLQLAQGIADLRGIAGLAFGAIVQGAAHAGQGMAAAGDLLGVVADGADQLDQINTQTVE
ncbi:hypothetical protein D9M71_294800 [compost metagenome]